MKRKYLILLCSLLLLGQVRAADITVSGTVWFGDPPSGASGFPVGFSLFEGGIPVLDTFAVTDDDGYFEFSFSYSPDPDALTELQVSVMDFCTGELLEDWFQITQNVTEITDLSYHICAGIDPPPPPDGCEAFFSFEVTDDDPLTVQFFDLSFSDSDITSWFWDFGDGNTSTEPEPVHIYDAPSNTGPTYVVTLTIETDDCTSTVTQVIDLDANPCDCDLNVFDPVCVLDPATGVIHVFINACFAACDGFGPDDFVDCDNDCDCPDVFDPVCVATPNGGTVTYENACFAACDGFSADDFVDCNNDCDCPDVFDPVCVAISNLGTITYNNACFAACDGFGPDDFVDCDDDCDCPGVYDPVCVTTPNGLTITYENACLATCDGYGPDNFVDCDNDCNCPDIYDPVCVEPVPGLIILFDNECQAICAGFDPDLTAECDGGCQASFFFDLPDPASLEVTFIADAWTDEGDIVEWNWDFGDGTTGAGETVTHTYAAEGVYEVTLTIVTSEGCESTTVQHICIGQGDIFPEPDCQAMFSFIQSTDDPATLQFIDLSFGEITAWNWDFGDGNGSQEPHPEHTYAAPGIYTVVLTVATEDGCTSSVTMLVFPQDDSWYNAECNALFAPFFIPESNTVFFFNLSSGDAVSYLWDLGDGTTSEEAFLVHEYAEPGVYTVTLTITTANGCTSTFTAMLDLGGNNFTGSPEFNLLSDTEEIRPATAPRVYPNPAADQLTVELETEYSGAMQLDLLTLTGRLLRTERRALNAGDNRLQLDLSGLPAGIYYLRLSGENGQQSLRFVKQ